MQQEQSKETLPALPKPNQHKDESTRFFPNFPLLWFVLSLPKFLQDLAKKHPGEANKVSWEGEEKAGNVFQEPPPPAPARGGQ